MAKIRATIAETKSTQYQQWRNCLDEEDTKIIQKLSNYEARIARDQVQLMDLLQSIGIIEFTSGDDVNFGWKLLKEKVMMLYTEARAAQKDSTVIVTKLTGATKTTRADKATKESKIARRDEVKSSCSPRTDEAKGLLELKKSLLITSGSGAKDETGAGVETEEKQPTKEKTKAIHM
ncbi:unnamed protein product [Calypogeia fissa]